MAQISDRVKKCYLAALQDHHIPIQHIFLVGRYGAGNYTEWSDIDRTLISNACAGTRIEDRKTLRPITLSISSETEALPYSPEPFTDAEPFVKEILETEVKIL